MPSLHSLWERRCVEDVIHVVQQVPARAAARSPVELDDSSLSMIVLWTLLRWERTFWVICLEELGVDIQALSLDIDSQLAERTAASEAAGGYRKLQQPWPPRFGRRIDRFTNQLLDLAAREASAMKHGYLGSEHLLLALISGADAPLAELLARHRVDYREVKEAIAAALPLADETELVETAELVDGPRAGRPWGASWDSEAAGVPRRFSLGVLFLMMTSFAVLFAVMQMMDANPAAFVVVAVLVIGVGLGQTLLFGGQFPRAASIWIGACLFPVEILAVIIESQAASTYGASPELVAFWVILVLFCIPAGAFVGYLAGGITAGLFLVLDYVNQRRKVEEESPTDDGPWADEHEDDEEETREDNQNECEKEDKPC